jgi:hypothetical protein
MRVRLKAILSSTRTNRAAGAVAVCLLIPVLLGCIGIQLGPLGFHLGPCEPEPKPAPPPPKKEKPPHRPRPRKPTTLTEEPDGTLRQEGEISLAPRCCASVHYLRPFVCTPHLEVSERDADGVNFEITEQEPSHFTIKNLGFLSSRTFTWRARGANPAPRPAPEAVPLSPPASIK